MSALAARALFDPTTVPFNFGFDDLPLGIQILFSFALVNLFLGIFNLLPIPPLDGSALIERVLPAGLAAELVPVPAVRLPRAVHPRVHHRVRGPSILAPFADQLVRFVFG